MPDKPTVSLLSTRFSAAQRQALDSIDLALRLKLIDVITAIKLSTLVKAGQLEEVYQQLQ